MNEALLCPIVVGRDEQVAFLRSLIAEAEAGRSHAALLAGEAGIGKSRLARVAREQAAEHGWRVVQGNFFETDRTLPFGGLIDLVRAHQAGDDPSTAPLPPEIAHLLPELDQPALAADPDSAQEKRRLFHAFATFLLELTLEQPLLIVIEDLHWADDASLEFLLYFARLITSRRLLLILTYRSDEVHPALAHLLTGLDRERRVTELPLGRLSLSEVDRMLRVMLKRSRSVRPEVLHAIHALTDGNPFFVEEVVRSVAGSAGDDPWDQSGAISTQVPRSVDESVRRRSQQLDGDARRVLELAAVAGRRFDFELLLPLAGLDEAGLLSAIKELIQAQLVVEESSDRFAFRHALTRQAVYSGLLLRERRTLHQRIEQTLAASYEDALAEHCEDLAYHAFQAEDWVPALAYLKLAAERATALYSPAAAVEHFTRALAAAGHVETQDAWQLYRGRGQAYETLGEFDAALADYESALTEARARTDFTHEWQSLLDLGMLWASRDYDRAGGYFEQAEALAHAIGDPATIAHSLNRVGNWLGNVERPWEGVERHEQALAIFETLHDRSGVAGTLDLLAMASLLGADLARSTRHYRAAIDLFEALNDRQGLASALCTLPIRGGVYHSNASQAEEKLPVAMLEGLRGEQIAKEIGWRSAESYALWNLALSLGPQGEYGRAFECARGGLAIADEIEHTSWQTVAHLALACLYLDVIELDAAREHLEKATMLAGQSKSMFWIRMTLAEQATLHIMTGELAAAEIALQPTLDAGSARTLAGRQAHASWIELALAQGRYEEALLRLEILDGDPANQGFVPRLARSRARAFAGLGRQDEAEALFKRTLAACADQGRRGLAWRLRCDLTRLYLDQGKAIAASNEAETALGLIDELAATLPDEAMRDRFRQHASEMAPGGPKRPRATSNAPGGLTQREREVAVFVAQGLSNRGIAEALVLSDRTVESHVANALSKLGFSSRSQLAAWTVENHLTATS